MKLQEIFCPACGEKIKIDTQKPRNFCQKCGFQIETDNTDNNEAQTETASSEERTVEKSEEKEPVIDTEKKLDEVDFYYQLSRQKKEATYDEKNPKYYLKAQDLLLELAEQKPDDYRIWWELSKPLDYQCEETEISRLDRYGFHEEYFSKALDFADVPVKKELIRQRELYEKKKNEIRTHFLEEREQKKLKEDEARRSAQEKAEKERIANIRERQRQEQCTVRGVMYQSIEEAEQAKREHELIDNLKKQLLTVKQQKKRQDIFGKFEVELEIPEVKNRYEVLRTKVLQKEPLSERLNLIYGITVLVTFVLGLIVEMVGMDGEITNFAWVCLIWAGFGVWIWPIWKIALHIRSRSKDYCKNIGAV